MAQCIAKEGKQREVTQCKAAELRSEPKTQAPRAHLPELCPLKLPLGSNASRAPPLCCNHGLVLSSMGLGIATSERRPSGCTSCSQSWLHPRITPGGFKTCQWPKLTLGGSSILEVGKAGHCVRSESPRDSKVQPRLRTTKVLMT